MNVNTINRGRLKDDSLKHQSPLLIAGNNIQSWLSILTAEHGIEIPTYSPDGGFPIMALHIDVEDARYRGYTLTMTGKLIPGSFHYFSVPQHYFYKTKLFFEVFDKKSNKLLARHSFFMPDTQNNHSKN
jgi:hypothetical protein